MTLRYGPFLSRCPSTGCVGWAGTAKQAVDFPSALPHWEEEDAAVQRVPPSRGVLFPRLSNPGDRGVRGAGYGPGSALVPGTGGVRRSALQLGTRSVPNLTQR